VQRFNFSGFSGQKVLRPKHDEQSPIFLEIQSGNFRRLRQDFDSNPILERTLSQVLLHLQVLRIHALSQLEPGLIFN